MKCNACGFEFEGKFCANCGTPAAQTPAVRTAANATTTQSRTARDYHVESIFIKAGMLNAPQDLIPKKVQPMLDMGVKEGWKLHTFSSAAFANGINICLVWEI